MRDRKIFVALIFWLGRESSRELSLENSAFVFVRFLLAL
jgi:hypothetical protein